MIKTMNVLGEKLGKTVVTDFLNDELEINFYQQEDSTVYEVLGKVLEYTDHIVTDSFVEDTLTPVDLLSFFDEDFSGKTHVIDENCYVDETLTIEKYISSNYSEYIASWQEKLAKTNPAALMSVQRSKRVKVSDSGGSFNFTPLDFKVHNIQRVLERKKEIYEKQMVSISLTSNFKVEKGDRLFIDTAFYYGYVGVTHQRKLEVSGDKRGVLTISGIGKLEER